MFKETSAYEASQIAQRIDAGEGAHVAVHRIYLITQGATMRVIEETNDDNDDGYPDGAWVRWESEMDVERAKKYAGPCRVGTSGVIVTVTLDGEEVR